MLKKKPAIIAVDLHKNPQLLLPHSVRIRIEDGNLTDLQGRQYSLCKVTASRTGF